jgi:hypothetical protein
MDMPNELYTPMDVIRPGRGPDPVSTVRVIIGERGKLHLSDTGVDIQREDVLRQFLPNGNVEHRRVLDLTVYDHPELGNVELVTEPCAPPRATTPAPAPARPAAEGDTWWSRDRPVLRAIVDLVEADPAVSDTAPAAVGERTGLDDGTIQVAVRALESGGLISQVRRLASGEAYIIGEVTGLGRQKAGAWPDPETASRDLIDALRAIAEDSTRPADERTRARKILGALVEAGRDVGLPLLTAAFSKVMGLS